MPPAHDIDELSPAQAHRLHREGATLVDIREDGERASGSAAGALGLAGGRLEADPARWLPDPEAQVLVLCARGQRSLQTARRLRTRGYRHVRSVAGGTEAWRAAGLPMSAPQAPQAFLDRYSRQLRLPEIGLDGQRRLSGASVVLVGAGGLGCPAALYLAAAGIGRLRLVDDDLVERSNLHRQVLHADAAIGRPKVASGAERLASLNPEVKIDPVHERIEAGNVDALLRGHEVVIDGSDNFDTRYLVNDACVRLGLPMVYGAVHRFEGQVSVFQPARDDDSGCCYRCLFPEPPPAEFAPNCAQAGVLGVLPGVIGLLQATEALKLLLGVGDSLSGRLLRFDALEMRFDEVRLVRDPACPACGPGRAVDRAGEAPGG